uniref:Uncharacterized protein n=2 Tax=Bursaphelenchus xylophilus TaxID=6326 RepID=A0A1I7SD63_BURXY
MVSRAVSKPIDITGAYRREPFDHTDLSYSTSAQRTAEPKHKPVIRVRPQIKKPETPKTNHLNVAVQQGKVHSDVNKENVSFTNKVPLIYNLYANPSPSTIPFQPNPLRFKDSSECSCGGFDCLATASHHASACWDVDDENQDLECFPSLPAGFRSVGDVIGYANVVRAQRQEALGKLDLALLHLNNLRRERQRSARQ